MKEITMENSFVGGSKSAPNLEWTMGEGKAKRTSSKPKPKPKAKRASSKPKPKAKRASSKPKPKAKRASSKKVMKKKGGQTGGQTGPTEEQRIVDPLEVISFSPPSMYAKYKIAQQLYNSLGRVNRVVDGTQQDTEALQRLANQANQDLVQQQGENIYNVRRNPYDINQDPYNVDNKALDTGRNFGETEDAGDAIADGDADATAEAVGDTADVGEALEGLADFFGLAFGAGKKKGKTTTKKRPKKTNAQWKRKKRAVINKIKKNKKKLKKVGRGFVEWLENLPENVDDGFITIHDAVTGNNSWGNQQIGPDQLPIWNTWGMTQSQVNDKISNSIKQGVSQNAILMSERQVHHPTYERQIPGVINSGSLPYGSGKIKGGAGEKKEKTQEELQLMEATKRMKDSKRRFENAVKEYYADFKQKLIDTNNIDTKNKDIMKDLNKYIAWHKKAGLDKLKTTLAWAHSAAYTDELNRVLSDRPNYVPNRVGLGRKKRKAGKPARGAPLSAKKYTKSKKTATKKKRATSKKTKK